MVETMQISGPLNRPSYMGCPFYTPSLSRHQTKASQTRPGPDSSSSLYQTWPSRAEVTGKPLEPARPKWEAHQDQNQVPRQTEATVYFLNSHKTLQPIQQPGKGTNSFRAKGSFCYFCAQAGVPPTPPGSRPDLTDVFLCILRLRSWLPPNLRTTPLRLLGSILEL